MVTVLTLEQIRARFPALSRQIDGRPAIYFDGPAGSQVPASVPRAIADYMIDHNANRGGAFASSRETDGIVLAAQKAVADLFGTPEYEQVIFGGNMTSLTFAMSRAIATEWNPGDEILVTRLDHDANVSPWVLAARDRGATVRHIDIDPETCTLDLDDFRRKLSPRTKFMALGCASNAVGTRNPVREMIREAHAVGCLVFLDAVHFAPHAPIDVVEWDCDFIAASAYKFFGPHVGTVWGKRTHLERLPAYKVRPSAETLPDRWMTGTQNFEGIAGVLACVEYLADLGRELRRDTRADTTTRREAIVLAMGRIEIYERELSAHMLRLLSSNPEIRVYGLSDPTRCHERVPTFSFRHIRLSPRQVAEQLAARGIFVWNGNYYALPLTERLGLEPQGMVRAGLLHYNTTDEVDRFAEALRDL